MFTIATVTPSTMTRSYLPSGGGFPAGGPATSGVVGPGAVLGCSASTGAGAGAGAAGLVTTSGTLGAAVTGESRGLSFLLPHAKQPTTLTTNRARCMASIV